MKPLIWGQRVRAAAGWVGRYEGILCAERPELLRVYWESADGTSSGVCYLESDQLSPIEEHPVCLHRRLRAAGLRPPRRLPQITPDCYLKDYGKTMADLAHDAFAKFLSGDIGDEEAIAFLHRCGNPPTDHTREELLTRLTGAMLHFRRAEMFPSKPRRLRRADLSRRLDPEAIRDRRWLRTRKQLRARPGEDC